jgi:serine/threonine-protein kinase
MGNLREFEIFKNYSDELLTELAKAIIEKEYDENEIIFHEGDKGDSIYLVEEGEVSIKRSLEQPGDEEKTIAMIERGNFFGEMALFDSKPRSGSAYASKKSKVLILKKEDFLDLTKKDPNTAMTTLMTINKVMSERLRKTSKSFLSRFEFGNILSTIRGFIKGVGGIEEKTDIQGEGFGRYKITRELGRGSMGVVYEGRDPQIDRPVALKVLRQDRITSEAFLLRFLREAKAIGRLSHPCIVTIFDVGQDRGTIYLAMEFIEGETLDTILEKKKLSLEEIIHLGIQIAETLDYAHQKGIIHRDVKPSNIILQANGQIKITDFGIARIEDPSMPLQTQAGEILGTPAYMSPEQVLSLPVDGRSDLFSLGIILYEATTGSRPFKGDNMASIFNAVILFHPMEPSSINPAISQSLSRVIMKCLNKKPEDRFDSGKSLAGALKDSLLVTKSPVVPHLIEKKRRPIPFLIPIAISVILLAALFYYLLTPKGKIPSAVLKTEPVQKIEKVLSAPLVVESTPAGVQIFVDGMFRGNAPIKLQLPVGKHEVRATLSGYEDWNTQVELKEDGETPLHIQLKSIVSKEPEVKKEPPIKKTPKDTRPYW